MQKMFEMLGSLWARIAILIACAGIAFLQGQIHGERVAGKVHADYMRAQEKVEIRTVHAQSQVIYKTDVQYRDRIRTIYVKGETIEKTVPVLVTPDDNDRFGVNVGFVRNFNAAWANEPAGSANDTDRGPATIPLADIAAAEAANATACYAWREQAIGLRDLYQQMKKAMDEAKGSTE